ncbi:hypothetical protein RZS08_10440, partial [Arthrospira platensis SPKY1]|nr:hypothetical protein [Arthrospira platensis SPKY1]
MKGSHVAMAQFVDGHAVGAGVVRRRQRRTHRRRGADMQGADSAAAMLDRLQNGLDVIHHPHAIHHVIHAGLMGVHMDEYGTHGRGRPIDEVLHRLRRDALPEGRRLQPLREVRVVHVRTVRIERIRQRGL